MCPFQFVHFHFGFHSLLTSNKSHVATGFWPAALQAANSELRDKVAEGRGGGESVSRTECLESIGCLLIHIHRDIGAYMYTHINAQNADIHMYIYVYIYTDAYRECIVCSRYIRFYVTRLYTISRSYTSKTQPKRSVAGNDRGRGSGLAGPGFASA